MSFSVETIANFDKELKRLAKKYPSLKHEVAALGKSLAENPSQGTSIGKDCSRFACPSKAKGKTNQEVPV